jgi:hypothetical protein
MLPSDFGSTMQLASVQFAFENKANCQIGGFGFFQQITQAVKPLHVRQQVIPIQPVPL